MELVNVRRFSDSRDSNSNNGNESDDIKTILRCKLISKLTKERQMERMLNGLVWHGLLQIDTMPNLKFILNIYFGFSIPSAHHKLPRIFLIDSIFFVLKLDHWFLSSFFPIEFLKNWFIDKLSTTTTLYSYILIEIIGNYKILIAN